MKNILKLFSLFSLFAMTLFANDEMNNKCTQTQEKCCFCTSYPAEPKCPVYNFPYIIKPCCGTGLFFTGSYLYWQAKEQNLDLGYAPMPPATFPTSDTKTIKMKFDYNSGFKIGAGYIFNNDNWDLSFGFTRYTNHNHNQKDVGIINGVQIFNVWLKNTIATTITTPNLQSFTSTNFISCRWSLKYDIFDLMLSRSYFVGKKFVLKPSFGLSGGWIDQRYNAEGNKYRVAPLVAPLGVINTFSNNKSDSWLIGPKAFLNLNWIACKNLKFFGNVGAGIFYQHFKLDTLQFTPVQAGIIPLNTMSHIFNKFNFINPSFESSIGIGYYSCVFSNKFGFNFDIAYDFKYLWNQNLLPYNVATSSITFALPPTSADHLMFHGLSFSLGLDF